MVGSVLLLVALGHTLAGELALLPDRHEASTEPQRKSGAKEEATALKTNNNVDLAFLANSGVEDGCDLELEGAHKVGEVGVVGENGHDILKEDAGRREVGELAQGGAQVYFKTGEFGGTGGIGGGESSLGGIAGSGGRVGLASGRVGGGGGSVDVLGGGSGVVGVAVRRVLGVRDRSAAHIEGSFFYNGWAWAHRWAVEARQLVVGVRSAVQGPRESGVQIGSSGLGTRQGCAWVVLSQCSDTIFFGAA